MCVSAKERRRLLPLMRLRKRRERDKQSAPPLQSSNCRTSSVLRTSIDNFGVSRLLWKQHQPFAVALMPQTSPAVRNSQIAASDQQSVRRVKRLIAIENPFPVNPDVNARSKEISPSISSPNISQPASPLRLPKSESTASGLKYHRS